MAVDPSGIFTITAPASTDGRGEIAVLNDPTSPNFVGWVTGLSGFDSPEVRENADDITEGDGGVHGSFYYGRRPFTVEMLFGYNSIGGLLGIASLNAKIDKLFRATNAMRADGTVVWTETGSAIPRLLNFRRQQVRFDERKCLFGGVSADPRIYSSTVTHVNQPVGSGRPNLGNAGSPPIVTLTSPTNTITISRTSPSPTQTLTLTGLSGAGTVTVDFGARTVTATVAPTNRYSAVSFPSSEWWEMQPGNNTIAVTGATGLFSWRDAWL